MHKNPKRTFIMGIALAAYSLSISPLRAQDSPSPQISRPTMPDERFYSLIFHHMLYLQTHGLQPASSAAISPSIENFYVRRVGATGQESASLVAEARKWQKEVDPVDAQAKAMIDAIHARTPGGQLAPGEQPPPVPDSLIALQHKRDALTLSHIAALRSAMGEARFAAIDLSLRREAHVSIRGQQPAQAVSQQQR